jgi:ribosome biogenesis protein SSF1/2
MNNFTSPPTDASKPESKNKVPRHLESLTTTMFQSLFPPISPQATPLSSIRRVLLLNREIAPNDDGTYIINLRHYAITTKKTGLSRPLRRLNAAEKLLHQGNNKKSKASLPNLGKLEDIADFMIGGENGEGYMTDATSGSEIETDAEVEMLESTTRRVLNSKARQRARAAEGKEGDAPGVEKRAVKLVELGPRMRLRMTKVEEGVCNGKVMWHEYIHKTAAELKEMDKVWEKRRQEKEARKKIQKENVERKRKAKGLGAKKEGDDEDDDDEYDEMDVDEWDSEGLEGDAEMGVNEDAEEEGNWEDQEQEIAAG